MSLCLFLAVVACSEGTGDSQESGTFARGADTAAGSADASSTGMDAVYVDVSGDWTGPSYSGADSGTTDLASSWHSSVSGDMGVAGSPQGNTNVNLSGSSDIGFLGGFWLTGWSVSQETLLQGTSSLSTTPDYPRWTVVSGGLPPGDVRRHGNLIDGSNCTMMQLGLNSPSGADPRNRHPLTLALVVDT